MPHRSIHALLQPFMPEEAHGYCGMARHDKTLTAESQRTRSRAEFSSGTFPLRYSASSASPRLIVEFLSAHRNIHAPFQPFMPEEAHGYCGKALLI
jgi:hypothetical protein